MVVLVISVVKSVLNVVENTLICLADEIKKVEIDSVFDKEIIITLDTTSLDLYGLTLTDIYGILLL